MPKIISDGTLFESFVMKCDGMGGCLTSWEVESLDEVKTKDVKNEQWDSTTTEVFCVCPKCARKVPVSSKLKPRLEILLASKENTAK